MNEQTKTEGSFKIQSKPKLTDEQLAAKNREPLIDVPSNVTRVVIPKEEKDANPEPSAGGMVDDERTENIQEVEEKIPEPVIKEITEEEKVEVKAEEPAVEPQPIQNDLPENINKLVDFMKETGGTLEDYVRLNADYSNVDNDTLLREYYKQAKSHLDSSEINFMIEDNFSFDEEVDEEREIRKKKLAYKEEVAKAKSYLDSLKDKYYAEIKLRPGINPEQQKATDFFNRYNEEQELSKVNQERFRSQTDELLNNEFKGFDFKVGEKKFRYGVKDPVKVADNQKDISTFIKTFLNDKGEVVDTKGYHKALYAARNADTIAQHFYEQGKSDATKNLVAKSKNISEEVRSIPTGEVFVGGLKVKAISGMDSSKLKIKTRKFN